MGAVTFFLKCLRLMSLYLLLPAALVLAGAAGASWFLIDYGKGINDNSNWFEAQTGIDEEDFVTVGGVDQYIRIRGRDRSKPVLLDLHGGPGNASSGINHRQYRPLTEYFVVVEWDQRGAGKSASDDAIVETMSYDRMVDDAIEMIEHLQQRLSVEKVVLVGHSWGSILGIGVIKKRPDLISAYVGVGQVVAWNAGFDETARLLMAAAEAAGDAEIAEELRALPDEWPPKGEAQAVFQRIAAIQGKLPRYKKGYHALKDGNMLNSDLMLDLLLSPDLEVSSILGIGGGAQAAATVALIDDLYGRDVRRDFGYDYEVPMFIFQGEHDWQTPTTLVKPWFAKLNAPYKQYVAFEDSAHYVFPEEPGKYIVSFVNEVLPVVLQSASGGVQVAAEAPQEDMVR